MPYTLVLTALLPLAHKKPEPAKTRSQAFLHASPHWTTLIRVRVPGYAYQGTRTMQWVPFVDRTVEMEVLEREYARPGFSLVVVYGRRRIGKTRLLREWIRGKRAVYFVAAEISYTQLSQEFSKAVGEQLGVYVPPTDIVEALEKLSEHGKIVVVLDEFQYMVEADPSLPSRLMRSIDTRLRETELKIVLCGSAVSFFEKKLLGYQAPLHGRRTAQIKLKPMRLREAYPFLQAMNAVDALRAYSILGGTPAYLEHAYNKKSLRELLEDIMKPGHPLLYEAPSLLRQELREPRTYMALLAAVAQGKTRPAEAAQAAGVDPRTIHRYLEVLEELEIAKRRTPLGYRRGARIFITDEYFRFWFRYMISLQSLVEIGYTEEAVEHVLETIDQHTAQTLVAFTEQHLPELHQLGAIPTRPAQHGPWWHRDKEIDLVVRDPGNTTTFIEAKWTELTLEEAMETLDQLEEKARHTGLQAPTNYYVLIARDIQDQDKPIQKHQRNKITVSYTKLAPHILTPQHKTP